MRLLLFLFLFISSLSLCAQKKTTDMVAWKDRPRLSWSDYLAAPDKQSDAAATTTTFLGLSYNISEGNFTYNISCQFSRNQSWGLYKTGYILAHEQGHFDIAEIFARKLHEAIATYKFNRKHVEKDLEKIYKKIVEQKDAFQQAYDRETNHSINKEKQAEWLKRIEKMLEETDEYADYS